MPTPGHDHAGSRRQALAEVSTLLNCSRPDLPAQSLLVSALIGGAFASICVVLSFFENEAATIRGFLATGLYLAVPWAVFRASARIVRGAKILFQGGEPVLLALGFHDRRLAVGLAGGTMLHALASMAGTVPVLVLIGTSIYIPIGRLLGLAVALTIFAVGATGVFATARLMPQRRLRKVPTWITILTALSVLVVYALALALMPGGISNGVNFALAGFVAMFGAVGLHATYLFATGEPVSVLSLMMTAVTGVIAMLRTAANLSVIPEGEEATPAEPAAAPAPREVPAVQTTTPAEPSQDLQEVSASAMPQAAAVPPAQMVPVADSTERTAFTSDTSPPPRSTSDPKLPEPAVATADAIPPEQSAVESPQPPPAASIKPPARRTDATPRRKSERWPESDLYREWNRRIMPASGAYQINLGVSTFAAVLFAMGLLAAIGRLAGDKDLASLLSTLMTLSAVVGVAVAAFGAIIIPRRLLESQLSGGTEALVMAGITPRMLIRRAFGLAVTLSGGVVAGVLLGEAVKAGVLHLSGPVRTDIAYSLPALLALLVFFGSAAIAIPAASALGTIWRSSELVRTILMLLAVGFAPIAAIVLTLMVLAASRDFTDDRNLGAAAS